MSEQGTATTYLSQSIKTDLADLMANQIRILDLLEQAGVQSKTDMADFKANQTRILGLLEQAGVQKQRERPCVSQPTIDAVLTSARDLATIQEASSHQLRSFPDHDVVVCEVCQPNFDPNRDLKAPKTTGVLQYNFSEGTSFPKPSALPRLFVRLKAAIRTHLASASHRKMEDARQKEQEESAAHAKVSNVISSRVLRTAYHVLMESLSREEFEELIVMQNLNGLNMGDLCHSGSQMKRFRDAFSDVVLDALADHVKAAPCVSWIADKVTVNGRTLDITGLLTLVPEAPADALIQSVVIGAPVVKEHDGTSLADEWLQTAARVGITDVRKLAAICTDGQYHHLSVPTKFLTKLTASHPDYAARAEPPCVPCLWDGAHLLDLADGSARAEPGCSWVGQTVEAVTRITKRYTMGKGHEVLRTASEEKGLPMRGLQLWSETRFSPYAARVLTNFIANIPVLAVALKEQLDSAATKGSLIAELTSDLRLLTGTKGIQLRAV